MQKLTQGWRPYVLLTLLCALIYIPGIAQVPPLDRDESRFVQATRQMMVTDDYVTIWFQDQPRHKKPVGIHWLQSASVSALGHPEATEIWALSVGFSDRRHGGSIVDLLLWRGFLRPACGAARSGAAGLHPHADDGSPPGQDRRGASGLCGGRARRLWTLLPAR